MRGLTPPIEPMLYTHEHNRAHLTPPRREVGLDTGSEENCDAIE